MHDRPVFVFATHRSGSTLLERILNCHPNLVIWGEHAGVINHFVEIDQILRRFPQLSSELPRRNLSQFIRGKNALVFDPWRTPVSREGVRSAVKSWMIQTFATGVTPDQRWGFKEIRYGGTAITEYLRSLFPSSQFIILRRDPVDLCTSNILVPWSLNALREIGSFQSEQEAEAVVSDCAYALAAMDWRLQKTVEAAGTAALTVRLEELTSAPERVLEFLGLPLTTAIRSEVEKIARTPLGATNKELSLGKLNRPSIELWARKHVPIAREEISRHGLDISRLLGDGYCFLVGDHDLRKTRSSTMGWSLQA